jgi:hypothetical protein
LLSPVSQFLTPMPPRSGNPRSAGGIKLTTLEEAVRAGDVAFVGRLEWYDVSDEHGSARIRPQRVIWGDLPSTAIELGRHRCQHIIKYTDQLPVCEYQYALLSVICRARDSNQELLFITQSERWKDGFPLTDDLAALRKLDQMRDSAQLRDELIDAVIDPDAQRWLWSYALQRLYSLEDDPDRRFDLVLHPRLQKEAPHINWDRWANSCCDRLAYAANLLTAWELTPKQRLSDSKKMLEAFEKAPTACMAATALEWWHCSPAGNFDFAHGKDCGDFYSRVRAALQNPNHPIHEIGPDWRERVKERVKDIQESYIVDPRAPFVEQAVGMSEVAFEGILNDDHVLPKRLLWGKLPPGRVPADLEYLILIKPTGGMLDGRFGAVSAGSYGVFFWNDELKELRFALPSDSKNPIPRTEVMRIRSLVSQAASDDLRRTLVEIVLQPDASDLVWTYALRRLYLLKEKGADGFEQLLNQRIQAEAPADRLEYAVALLVGKEIADPFDFLLYDDGDRYPHGEWGPGCKAKKRAFLRLLENLQSTPSPAMTEITLSLLADDSARDVQFSDEEWAEIRSRITAAVQNPEHGLHKLPVKRKEAANLMLERFLHHPFAERE